MNPENISIQTAKETFLALGKANLVKLNLKRQITPLNEMKNEPFYEGISHLIKPNGKFHDLVEEGFQRALTEVLNS